MNRIAQAALNAVPPLRRLKKRADRLDRQNTKLVRETDRLRRRNAELAKSRKGLTDKANRLEAVATGQAATYGYLFIVTYGRSGSTLLSGIINSIPGYVMRGENQGVITELFRYHNKAMRRRRQFGRNGPTRPEQPWWGIEQYDPEVAFRDMRRLMLDTLLRPEADTRVIGYKEIRYDVPDLAALLTFMRNVFPGARFIFNSRDHAYVLKSKWWANNPNGPEKLQRFQASLDAAQEAHEAVSYRVRYDDYNGHPESLQGLFEFLGEPFDVDRIAAVMAVPHSY